MALTFDQYIANPLGKRNAVMSSITRESIRANYTNRFNNILLRENGIINYYTYKSSTNDYIIHIKIPSELVKKFYYDVVIRFYTDSKVADLGRNLSKYYFQVYSNDPAFVYTHAYVFLKNNLFFKDLQSKMSPKALKQVPKVTNPTKELAYVKSIYFAYLFMTNRNLFKTAAWSNAEPYVASKLINNIMPAEDKIRLRQEEGAKISKRKQIVIDKNTAKKLHKLNLSDGAKESLVVTTDKVPTIKKTKAINSSRKSRVLKKK